MDLTYVPPTAVRTRPSAATRYVGVLAACLLGYALFNKPFAYIGVPPVFLGEVLLLVGVAVALRVGRVGAALSTWPLRLWAVLMVWTLVRTVPYLGAYGIDAPRDAMIVVYGTYAVVVTSLLLAEPDRLRDLVAKYWTMVLVYLCLAWVLYLLGKTLGDSKPRLPWAPSVGVFSAKGGDMMVHMTGIVMYMMLSARRLTAAQVVMAVLTAVIVMVSNRGGMVAFALGAGVAWTLRPAGTGAGKFTYAFAALMLVGLVVGPHLDFTVQGGTRKVSVEQMANNIKSIFVDTGESNLEGTERWRLLWWGDIVDYTVGGDYFWMGKGFGVNLAVSDGYSVSEEETLRSPHNGHMTVLARAGVPGAALWVALHLAWIAALLRTWLLARGRDQRRWVALCAWLLGFWVASMINASFDVYLEGPMGGIWVWTVIGVGVAAARLYQTRPDLLDDLDIPLPAGSHAPDRTAPVRPFSWT